jgi:predicted SnoaL-like aldol condensation-catalyzing enzyme
VATLRIHATIASGYIWKQEVHMTTTNADLVLNALTELFIKRDLTAIERHWSASYRQHNPLIPDGREQLAAFAAHLPDGFRYEPGVVVAHGDHVMIHGRYTGWGPAPVVAVDIFRIENGKLAEHWDVAQEEVPPLATKSGRSMFTGR